MVVGRTNVPLIETPAFVLARTDYGEADVVVQLLTEELGRISSLAKGARRSKKRYLGSLEPLHTIRVSLTDSARGEFVPLRDAVLLKPRPKLTTALDEMRAAGQALRWMKKAAPPKTPEPLAFAALQGFLDELEAGVGKQNVTAKLGTFGLRMLTAFGWGLELSACVGCGRRCPEGRPAFVSPQRGGLICRSCGGGPIKVTGELRAKMRAASLEAAAFPEFDEADKVLKIVERCLEAHLGFSPGQAR